MSSLASCSLRCVVRASLGRRHYAAPSNPHTAAPSDSRLDVIRSVLYPADAPARPSPSGVHRPDVLARLRVAVPSPEVAETIERAYALHSRGMREARAASLAAKHAAMVEACDELKRLAEDGAVKNDVYEKAMGRMNHASGGGRPRKTPEDRFVDGRIEGLVPREAWVPVESRGKGWNYEWRRPGKE
ncbi:hypothetical protein Q5752_003786 [Cryptotrichosporon argae]